MMMHRRKGRGDGWSSLRLFEASRYFSEPANLDSDSVCVGWKFRLEPAKSDSASLPGPPSSAVPLLRRSMPELDTIRGLAILAVILYHGLYWRVDSLPFTKIERWFLAPMAAGRLGVDLFFVLSGFLITGILNDSRSADGYYRHFYIRRALRIFPAYLALIAILAATKTAPFSFILLSLLYLSNLTPLLGVPVAYPILWSLAVEEHFYFVWPFAVQKLRSVQLMICCIAVICLSPISRLISFFVTSRNGAASYVCNDYTWNALDGLACGALLALLIRYYNPSRKQLLWFSTILFVFATAIFMAGLPFGIMTRQTPTGAALQVVPWHFAFTGLLGFFLLIGTGKWKYLVQPRSIRFLGEISYGLYLIHVLIFQLLDWAAARYWKNQILASSFQWLLLRLILAGSVSILLAFLSRKYFEERFLRMKNRFT
jgi:peptidoglycan/LPS O-acetylase OafA/YrhL